jgi:fructose-bisphosphate aldolase class I
MVDLSGTADRLMSAGKGLLAADESVHTADARLAEYGIKADKEMRRRFRDLFLDAPGIEEYLSGVILFTETLDEIGSDKKLFTKSLTERGILPGVKVDLGTEPFPESAGEVITSGLLDLPERLPGYAKSGAVFTKWRAVVTIERDKLPTSQCVVENMKRLASYAAEVQKAGLVPILEPEVLMEGKHSRLRAKEVLTETLKTLIIACKDQAVDLSGILIKTAMAVSGNKSGRKDSPEEVANDTLEALMAAVPKQVRGMVFLSGGQPADEAIANLRAISARARSASAPWPLSFSFARAFQDEALAIWKGEEENVPAARAAFLARLKSASDALAS